MTRLSAWKMARAVLLLWAATAIASSAQIFKTLVSFDGTNGAQPYFGSLVQGVDGNYYGTTSGGGRTGNGTIFKITPGGTLTTIYSFCSQTNCADGIGPIEGLVLATDGNFYGAVGAGGANPTGCLGYGCGTIFKITPTGTLTTIYSFCSKSGCTDGGSPTTGLVQARDGTFYGTTGQTVNPSNQGTVFKITPAGTLTTLYTFCLQANCPDGKAPKAGLVLATNGNFYGTTYAGGANDGGTVFKITPAGTLTTLYSFCSQTNCIDGLYPNAAMVLGTDGDLYGTALYGGASNACIDGCGTIFKITPAGKLTTLHSFDYTDGGQPYAGLVQANDGNFYGTNAAGGAHNAGTVFSFTPRGKLRTLYSFCSTMFGCGDGNNAYAGLLQATDGTFYATTELGGTSITCTAGCGTVFSLSMGLGPFVAFVRNPAKVGQAFGILGQGLTGTTGVSLNGTPARFTVVSDTFIEATVPPGATTGYVKVVTPGGTLTSNVPFHVIP